MLAGNESQHPRDRQSARSRLLWLHRWTGLTVGLVLVFVAITGILIAYRPQLERVVNRDLLTVPACSQRVPLDVMASNARAAHPAGKLDHMRMTGSEPDADRIPAVRVRIAEPDGFQDDVFVNPCSGEVVGQRALYGGWLATLEQLHRFRFMEGGTLISGTTALLFACVLMAGGLYQPLSRQHLSQAASVAEEARTGPRLSASGLHRLLTKGSYGLVRERTVHAATTGAHPDTAITPQVL